MQQVLINLLKALEMAVPPPKNCHHAITYATYGSDADGWVDKLALIVNVSGKFFCFFLDEDDLANQSGSVIGEVVKGLAEPERLQQGALGQYLPVCHE